MLLLLQYGERLSAETLALADPVLRRGADFWEGWSGMNLVDLAKLQIFRGLLFSNETLIRTSVLDPAPKQSLPRLRCCIVPCGGPAAIFLRCVV